MSKPPPYLIVCGCPRSGTSVMTQVLNSHERLMVGMERYKKLANPQRIAEIAPDCFTPERFFRFDPEETNILPDRDSRWRELYDQLRPRATEQDLVWGDKFPGYFRFYAQLAEQLDGVRFVFMLREFEPVASSFQVRADDPTDQWTSTAADAVKRWNRALRLTAEYLERDDHAPLFVCHYEAFFGGVPGHAHRLLRFLGLEKSPAFLQRYRGARKRYKVLTRNRQLVIGAQERAALSARADLELAEELRQRPVEFP